MRHGRFPLVLLRPTPFYLEVVRLAYNLVTALQRTCLPAEGQLVDAGEVVIGQRLRNSELPANRSALLVEFTPIRVVGIDRLPHLFGTEPAVAVLIKNVR